MKNRIMKVIPLPIMTLAMALVACSSTQLKMSTSPESAAARGSVSAKRADANTVLDIKVEHLAPPEKLSSNATTYVVWAEPSAGNRNPQNLGVIKIDEKSLKGKITTVTPLEKFSLFITPESSSSVETPRGRKVLWTSINAVG